MGSNVTTEEIIDRIYRSSIEFPVDEEIDQISIINSRFLCGEIWPLKKFKFCPLLYKGYINWWKALKKCQIYIW